MTEAVIAKNEATKHHFFPGEFWIASWSLVIGRRLRRPVGSQ
jgi:hypothetical protein